MIVLGHDGFYEDGRPVSNVWKPDFVKNEPAITQGIFGYKWDATVKDGELFGGILSKTPAMLSDMNYDITRLSEIISVKHVLAKYSEEKYYYPINVIDSSFWKNEESRYPNFDGRVLLDLLNGRAKILILYLGEALPSSYSYVNLLNCWAANYQLPKDSIVIISCSHDFGYFIRGENALKHITYNYWEKNIHDFIDRNHIVNNLEFEKKIVERGKRERKFLCYNRRHKEHRTLVVNELKKRDLLKHGFVSYGPVLDQNCIDDIMRITSDQHFLNMLPMTFDERDLEINFAIDFGVKDHMESYFQIVTESWWSNTKNTFFSEKVFKPMLGMQPFFLVSTPESLVQLRKNGYKTFSKWFDESYDNHYNKEERIFKIIGEVQRLCSLSEEELQSMLIDMLPTLKHNFKTIELNSKKIDLEVKLEELWK
jgi:hypothetical protein